MVDTDFREELHLFLSRLVETILFKDFFYILIKQYHELTSSTVYGIHRMIYSAVFS